MKMAADEKGNDLEAVGVVLTGTIGYAPLVQANVVPKADLASPTLELPDAFVKLGLIKQDGGAQDDSDQDDAIEFLQDGYKIAGDGSRTTKVTLAQHNDDVQRLLNGSEPDANGVYEIDSVTPDSTFIAYQETIYKNHVIRRRVGAARISTIEPDQEERGSVAGSGVTFEWFRHELFNNSFYWEVYIYPADES